MSLRKSQLLPYSHQELNMPGWPPRASAGPVSYPLAVVFDSTSTVCYRHHLPILQMKKSAESRLSHGQRPQIRQGCAWMPQQPPYGKVGRGEPFCSLRPFATEPLGSHLPKSPGKVNHPISFSEGPAQHISLPRFNLGARPPTHQTPIPIHALA